MAQTLYLMKNYNNYFNRIIKDTGYTSMATLISDNSLVVSTNYLTVANYNFPSNDGLTTTALFNAGTLSSENGYTQNAANLSAYHPDYIYVTSDADSIISRWFVIEIKKLRGEQFEFYLRRDVVAEYYSKIIKAPCFIEKAMLPDTNKLIYNSEGMDFNQIKNSETLLKDYTGVPWIVAYLARNYATDTTITSDKLIEADVTSSTFLYQFNTEYNVFNNLRFEVSVKNDTVRYGKKKTTILNYQADDLDMNSLTYVSYRRSADAGLIQDTWSNKNADDIVALFKVPYRTALLANATSIKNNIQQSLNVVSAASDILQYDGKIYLDTNTNKYYKITVSLLRTRQNRSYTSNALRTDMLNVASAVIADVGDGTAIYNGHYAIIADTATYIITKTEYTAGQLNVQISAARKHLEDAPYDMICMPYNVVNNFHFVTTISALDTAGNQQETILAIAQALGAAGGSGNSQWVYDIQILPYCPIQNLITTDVGTARYNDIQTATLHKDYDVIYQTIGGSQYPAGVIYYCSKSIGSFNIPYQLLVQNVKLENECDIYRLVSPNYQGAFEFNLAKNGGLQYFNVDYYYKPYNPFVHVNPNFGNLYGADFNDQRGLICSGDFSLSIVNDQFQTYEIANKNYQATFDRQIQNLEVQRKYQRIEQIAGIVAGSAGASVQGGMVGAAGGPIGAIAGGIIGGVGSIASGIADYSISESLFKENKSYQTDLFNFQLGNIKALPYTLSRSSQFTAIFKYFPFLEKYSCSDEEKQALINKIKYNGMTVNVIGKIEDYLNNSSYDYEFIQGQLIRLDELIYEDSHIIDAIYNEIKKGVFM